MSWFQSAHRCILLRDDCWFGILCLANISVSPVAQHLLRVRNLWRKSHDSNYFQLPERRESCLSVFLKVSIRASYSPSGTCETWKSWLQAGTLLSKGMKMRNPYLRLLLKAGMEIQYCIICLRRPNPWRTTSSRYQLTPMVLIFTVSPLTGLPLCHSRNHLMISLLHAECQISGQVC